MFVDIQIDQVVSIYLFDLIPNCDEKEFLNGLSFFSRKKLT